MPKSDRAKLDIPAEFQCIGCSTIAETKGLSTPPNGWRRRLDMANWPNRCVTWRCAGCVAAEAAKGGEL